MHESADSFQTKPHYRAVSRIFVDLAKFCARTSAAKG